MNIQVVPSSPIKLRTFLISTLVQSYSEDWTAREPGWRSATHTRKARQLINIIYSLNFRLGKPAGLGHFSSSYFPGAEVSTSWSMQSKYFEIFQPLKEIFHSCSRYLVWLTVYLILSGVYRYLLSSGQREIFDVRQTCSAVYWNIVGCDSRRSAPTVTSIPPWFLSTSSSLST